MTVESKLYLPSLGTKSAFRLGRYDLRSFSRSVLHFLWSNMYWKGSGESTYSTICSDCCKLGKSCRCPRGVYWVSMSNYITKVSFHAARHVVRTIDIASILFENPFLNFPCTILPKIDRFVKDRLVPRSTFFSRKPLFVCTFPSQSANSG